MQAIRELTDNMIFIGNEANATKGHIYLRDTNLGSDPHDEQAAEPVPLLTLRDNGRGMTVKTWRDKASSICRSADGEVGYTPDLAQSLTRYGGEVHANFHSDR